MYPTPSRGRFRQEEEKEGRVKGRERNNLAVEVTDGEVSTEGSSAWVFTGFLFWNGQFISALAPFQNIL